jgi:hypothetical protein
MLSFLQSCNKLCKLGILLNAGDGRKHHDVVMKSPDSRSDNYAHGHIITFHSLMRYLLSNKQISGTGLGTENTKQNQI